MTTPSVPDGIEMSVFPRGSLIPGRLIATEQSRIRGTQYGLGKGKTPEMGNCYLTAVKQNRAVAEKMEQLRANLSGTGQAQDAFKLEIEFMTMRMRRLRSYDDGVAKAIADQATAICTARWAVNAAGVQLDRAKTKVDALNAEYRLLEAEAVENAAVLQAATEHNEALQKLETTTAANASALSKFTDVLKTYRAQGNLAPLSVASSVQVNLAELQNLPPILLVYKQAVGDLNIGIDGCYIRILDTHGFLTETFREALLDYQIERHILLLHIQEKLHEYSDSMALMHTKYLTCDEEAAALTRIHPALRPFTRFG